MTTVSLPNLQIEEVDEDDDDELGGGLGAAGRLEGLPADEVEYYYERIKACQDPQLMADLAVAVGRELVPSQLRELYSRIQKLEQNELLAVFRSRALLWVFLLRQPQPAYRNTPISSHIRYIEGQGHAKSRKLLLVLFSGVGGDTFLPLARMLLRFPHEKFDVLRLRAKAHRDFWHGVPGAGDDLFDVCRYVAKFVPDYAGCVTLGASMGGYSALRAAVLLNACMGVSLAGRFVIMKRLNGMRGVSGFDPLCVCMSGRNVPLFAYFPSEHARDALHAKKLLAMHPPVNLKPQEGVHTHNVVAHMQATGTFATFFDDIYKLALADGGQT